MERVTKIQVLLVDDKEENLIALEQLLYDLPLPIVFLKAISGEEALKIAYSQEVGLILMDVQMPRMNGYEAAELLKENTKTKNIPIIFVTAINKEEFHVKHGYEKGAIDYLFKPLNPYITRAKVNAFLNLYMLNKQLENTALELKEINNNLEELNNLISHDLQAPLRTISFSAFNLEEKLKEQLDDQGVDLVHNIKVSTRRMKTLIEKLLQKNY